MRIQYNANTHNLQLQSILGSKFLTEGSQLPIGLKRSLKFSITRDMVDRRDESLYSWQTENNDFFSLIYLQLLGSKNTNLSFNVDWNSKKFVYRVACLMPNTALTKYFKNTFTSSYIFKPDNSSILQYKRLLIVQILETTLLIKLLRSSTLYYSVPIDALNICFEFQSNTYPSSNNLRVTESFMRFNNLPVKLL